MKKLFFNPFENYSENKLLVYGILGNLLLLILSFQFKTQFIGNLKINPKNHIELHEVMLQHAILVTITATLLFILGRYLNKKTRLIDIITTSLVSKIPFCLIPLLNINNKMFTISNEVLLALRCTYPEKNIGNNLIILLLFSAFTIIVMVWFFILLYNGFKTATNAKSSKSIVLFIVTVLIIEITSQILITKLA